MTKGRARLTFVIGGNAEVPRAVLARCYTAEGPKDVLIPKTGPLKESLDTIEALVPVRVEAYADDPPTRLLRACDFEPAGPADEGDHLEEVEQRAVTREERLMMLFANLLSKAYQDSHTAFRQLVRIAEHHATRANTWERQATQLHNQLLRQSQAMLRAQMAAAAEQAEQGDGSALSRLVETFMSSKEAGEAARTHANGAAPEAAEEGEADE